MTAATPTSGPTPALTVEKQDSPGLGRMLGRALVNGLLPGGGDTLPDRRIVQRDIGFDLDRVAAYADVCGFRLGDVLPGTYLHLLGFPLQIELMGARDFPFSLLGLVHVRNRIAHHRPVRLDETVTVQVGLADLRPHPKGRQFDVHQVFLVDDDVVWEGVSTYLRRGEGAGAAAEQGQVDQIDVADLPPTGIWKVPDDIGRRYGAVSGDRNPIHLSSLTAKAFGFPRAIAHGMWTAARALAGLEGRLPDAYVLDVAFKRPLLLPATVEYATRAADGGWDLGVRARRSGEPHLAGTLRPT